MHKTQKGHMQRATPLSPILYNTTLSLIQSSVHLSTTLVPVGCVWSGCKEVVVRCGARHYAACRNPLPSVEGDNGRIHVWQ